MATAIKGQSDSARLIIAGVSLSGGNLFSSMTNFNASGEVSSPNRTCRARL